MKKTHILTLCLLSIAIVFIAVKKINPSSSPNSPDENETKRTAHGKSTTMGESSKKHTSRRKRDRSRKLTEKKFFDINSLLKTEDLLSREQDFIAFISKLEADDFPQAIAEFQALEVSPKRMLEFIMLKQAWAKADPKGALDYTQKNNPGTSDSMNILTSWASRDAEAAVIWAENNYKGERRQPLDNWCYQWYCKK